MTVSDHEQDTQATRSDDAFARAAGEHPGTPDFSDRTLTTSRTFGDAEEVGEVVPEAQCKFTQISAGAFDGRLVRAEIADLTMHYVYSKPEVLNSTFLEAACCVLALPFRWAGDLIWDGRALRRGSVLFYPPGTQHVRRGRTVEGVALAVPLHWFESSVASLVGADVYELPLRRGEIATSPVERAALSKLVVETIAAVQANPRAFHDLRVQEIAAARIKSAVLSIATAAPHVEWTKRSRVDATRIVRCAEQCFDEARDHLVSLADLCRASGVSARTLQYAFECLCGMPPAQYFKRRRLSLARHALLESEPIPGKVKVAALDAGFLHLGRFSAEYRAQFGESPSETLRRSA